MEQPDYFKLYESPVQPKDGIYTIRKGIHEAVELNDIDWVHKYLNNKTSLNICDHNGWTPLGISVDKNLLEIAELLLIKGACPNYHSPRQKAPLHSAVSKGLFDMTKLLIDHKVDVNYLLPRGQNALFVAVMLNHTDIARLLIDNNADLSIQDQNDVTPLHFAVLNRAEELIIPLLSGDCDHKNAEVVDSIFKYSPIDLAEKLKLKKIQFIFDCCCSDLYDD